MKKAIADCKSIRALQGMRKDTMKKVENARKRIADGTRELHEIDLRMEQVGFEGAHQMRLPGL